MPVPHLRYAFVEVGSLRVGCIAIFLFFLLTGGYLMNKYLSMYTITLLYDENLTNSSEKGMILRREACKMINLSIDAIEVKRGSYVTMKTKGSLVIGSISGMYWLASVYGLISMIMDEVGLLIPPIIMFPILVFLVLFLIFFDLGITETKGFLYFYVLTGFVAKLILAAVTAYCFLIIYSYYKEETGGAPFEQELKQSKFYPTMPPPPTTTTPIPELILPPSPLSPLE